MMDSNKQNKVGQSSQHDLLPGALTPELVQQVADKVYALLLEDLQIEQERNRLLRVRSKSTLQFTGNW